MAEVGEDGGLGAGVQDDADAELVGGAFAAEGYIRGFVLEGVHCVVVERGSRLVMGVSKWLVSAMSARFLYAGAVESKSL